MQGGDGASRAEASNPRDSLQITLVSSPDSLRKDGDGAESLALTLILTPSSGITDSGFPLHLSDLDLLSLCWDWLKWKGITMGT